VAKVENVELTDGYLKLEINCRPKTPLSSDSKSAVSLFGGLSSQQCSSSLVSPPLVVLAAIVLGIALGKLRPTLIPIPGEARADLHFKDKKVGSLGWVLFAIVLLAHAQPASTPVPAD
jgi:hypothetical protein